MWHSAYSTEQVIRFGAQRRDLGWRMALDVTEELMPLLRESVGRVKVRRPPAFTASPWAGARPLRRGAGVPGLGTVRAEGL